MCESLFVVLIQHSTCYDKLQSSGLYILYSTLKLA